MNISTQVRLNETVVANSEVCTKLVAVSKKSNALCLLSKWLIACLFVCGIGGSASAQMTYSFSTGSNASLATDKMGNAIDMTSGTTQLVAAGTDDSPVSSLTTFFSFKFLGTTYTQFAASSNAIITLGVTPSTTLYSLPNSTIPTISPFANDLITGTDGVVRYKIFGSTPNRTLVVEWYKTAIRLVTSAPGTATFQVRLYESTNMIEFVYGEMATNAATPAAYYVGFSNNTTAGNVYTVNTTLHTSSTAAAATSNSYSASSTVTSLHSTSNGSRRYYLFTPDSETFTTAGASTWTAPCGVTSVVAECWGGGGGGGGTATLNGASGGGGGGGAYAKATVTVSPNTSYSYTVGSGGAGGLNTGATGTTGGSSSFNTNSVIAVGGAGGGGSTTATGGTAGAGGAAASCTPSAAACSGGAGAAASGTTTAGAGGSSAGSGSGTCVTGNPGSGTTAGAAPTGGYAGAAGRTTAGVGTAATQAGGGGGSRTNGTTARAGGNGGPGVVKISYTITLSTAATPSLSSSICSGATTVSGTSTEANGSTVTVYKNGVSWGTTTTITSNNWTVSGTALSAGDVITAKVSVSCKIISAASSSVTVTAASVGGTASATSSSVCLNGTTSITLTGNTGTIQWQRSEDAGTNWSNITGATSSSYTTSNLITGTSYRAVVTSGSCASANSSTAAVSISDANTSVASATTYNSGWSNGLNDNTTGMGAWSLSSTGTAGFFTGSSDVNNGQSRSWGMYASGASDLASAVRTVSLGVGNTLSFSMDNGSITSSKTIGFGLQNASGENLVELIFVGGQSFYQILDNAGTTNTSVAYTSGGIDVSIIYTASNTYTINITGKGGSTVSYTGRTFSTRTGGGQIPAQIRFFNAGAGSGSSYDLFFNSLSINNPVITTQPSTSTQNLCQNATPTNLTVVASGTSLTYQWYSNTTSTYSGGTSLGTGAQTASLTPSTASAGTTYYYCVVTGTCGSTYSKISGAVTVTTSTTSIAPSATQSISANTNGTTLTVTEGTNTLTSREWKYSTTSGSGYVSFGTPVTGTTYTPNFASAGTYYVVCQTTYSSPCSTTITSNEVTINVTSFTIATGSISGSPFCAGASVSVPFTYSPTADFTSSTFQAQLSDASGSFSSPVNLQTVASDASGSQSISVTIPSNTAEGTGYRIRVVSNSPALNGTDNGANLSVNATSVGGTATATSPNVCSGTGTTTISVSGNTGSTFQWQQSADGITGWTNVTGGSGATTSTYTTPTITAVTYYKALVSNGVCSSASSSTASVTPIVSVGGTASALSSSVCLNGTTTISVAGNTGTGFQWQRSEDGGSNWSNITGATSSTYTTSNLITATSYRVVVTYSTCASDNSSATTVSISDANTSSAGSATSWSNGDNDNTTGMGAWQLSASSPAGFFTGSSSINNGGAKSWGMYTGGNTNTASAVRTVSLGVGNTLSFSMDNGFVDNSKTIGFGLQNASGENLVELIFVGGQTYYQIVDNAGTTNTSVAYTSGGLDVSIVYTASNTYTINITSKGGSTVSYTGRTFSTRAGGQVPAQIRFFNAGAGSGSSYDLFFNSLSIKNPVITTHPSASTQSVCLNATPTNLTVAASGTGLSYQWYSNTTSTYSGGTSLGTGAQTATLTPSTASAGTTYYYCVVTGACGSTYSNISGAITVNALPSAPTAGNNGPVCAGSTLSLTASTIANSTYSWTGPNSFSSSLQNPTVSSSVTSAMAGTYSVTITDITSGCTSTSASTTVAVNNLSGVVTVGTGGDYSTLTGANGLFAAINSCGLSSNLTANIITDLTETGANALNAWTGGYTLTINPSGGATRTVSGAVAGAMIALNGADNVTIDGLNTGSNALVFVNSNTGATSSTIYLYNDATNNTIQNCTIKGSGTGTAYGTTQTSAVVLIGAGTATTGSGNDGNQILNNDITSNSTSYATQLIASYGTSAAIANDNITVSGNNLYNFFATTGMAAINVGSNSSAWTISNNKIYQTISATTLAAANYLKGIVVNSTSGSAFTISGNTIGYNSSAGAGMLTNSGGRFTGIEIASVAASPVSSIQGNTINGINWTSTSGATTLGASPFNGIVVSAGGVNVGTTTGNTIGSTSGTASSTSNIYITAGTGAGIYPIYVTSATRCTLQNNNIGAIATGGTAAIAYTFYGITIAGAGSHSVLNNTVGNSTANNIAIGIAGTTTGATTVYGIYSTATGSVSIGSTSGTGNTVRNMVSNGSSTTSYMYGIFATGAASNLDMNYNTISSNDLLGGTSSSTAIYSSGVANTGAVTGTININYNTISAVISKAAYSATAGFIYNLGAGSASTVNINNNELNGFDFSGTTGMTGTFHGIYQAGTPLLENINNNNFNNVSIKSTGAIYLIYNSYTAPAFGSKTIQNNSVVTSFTRTGTGGSGAFYGYYDNGSSPSTASHIISGNNFSNLSLNASNTGAVYGISTTDYSLSNPSLKIYNNTMSNVTMGSGSFYGMYAAGFSSSTGDAIYNNTISSLTSASTAIWGIYTVTPLTYLDIYGNNINNLSSTVSPSINGILQSASSTTVNIYNNNIHTLSLSGAGGSINGIQSAGATTSNIYNNFISNLTAPALSAANSVIGLNISGGTNANVYYNSISLNGTSSAATFGSSALYASTTTVLNLRNNILSNTCTPKGAGIASAFRLSSAYSGSWYASTSNNNDLYVGTPSSTKLLFYDGGTNSAQTLAQFKTIVSSRDLSSLNVQPNFTSSTDLHLDLASNCFLDGAASAISGYTTDFDNNTRDASTPDIGADEFTGSGFPTISSPAASTVCYSASAQTTSLTYGSTTGSPTYYSITWSSTPTNSFVTVSSATLTASPLTISIPAGTAAGTYTGTISVGNSAGCFGPGVNFTVTVNPATTIVTQPSNAIVLDGEDATFSVTASGTGLTYQWQVSTDNGSSWSNVSTGTSGGNTATLNVIAVSASMSGYQYQCIVTGASPCTSVTSNAVSLSVSSISITAQPVNQTICSNSSAVFSVTASGTGLSYQWYYSSDAGANWNIIADSTNDSMTFSNLTAASANNGYQYHCVINDGSNTVTSDPATLTVYDVVAITSQPTAQSICSNATSTSFSVTATGSNLAYQWQVNTGSGWTNVPTIGTSGGQTNTLTLTTISTSMSGYQYHCVVSGSSPCSSQTSEDVTLTVSQLPAITNMTTSICTGSSFTVTPANGTNGTVPAGITYNWSAPSATGITGLASGTGSSTINGTLTNTTYSPVNVVYTVTPVSGTCTTSTFTVTVTVSHQLNGTYEVGSGKAFSTLTAAVNAYNTSCLTGPVVFSLTDASYSASETFPISISAHNSASSTNTLTIKPASGISPVISGSSVSQILKLDGADYVTIDGSNNGTTSKDLTINNTSTSGVAVLLTNGATNNTIKNSTLKSVCTSTSLGTLSITSAGASSGNSSNSITNNNIAPGTTLPAIGVYNSGSVAYPNSNNTFAQNSIYDFSFAGIMDNAYSTNAVYNANSIYGTQTQTTTTALIGIYLVGSNIQSPTIMGNRIYDLKSGMTNNNTTAQVYGINIYDYAAGTTCNIINNMISLTSTSATTPRYGISGIADQATSGTTNIFNNSISIYGSGSARTWNVLKNFSNSTVVKNNIIHNTFVSTNYSEGLYFLASGGGTFTSNYNDLYSVGNAANYLGYLSSTALGYTSLSTWQSASGQDANSINVLPTFTSATDLHLSTSANCAIDGKGTPLANVTTDYDNATRDATTPDIGADEFVSDALITTNGTIGSVCFNSTASQTATLTYTASTNSLNSYSINWDNTANSANLADQAATANTFTAAGGSITTIAIPANVAAGTYNGTLTVTNAAGCSVGQAVTITITPISSAPTVTAPICSGATSVSGTSTEADGSTITVYKGGVSIGTATVSSGAWSLTGISTPLATGNVITAKVTTVAGKCESAASSSVTVITALSGLTYTASTISSCEGAAISTNSVTAITGEGTITYSISPSLPAGLTLNGTTGAITGTPTTATAAANYTVTASNGCSTTTATINIEVLTPMSGLSYTSASVIYCTGSAITTNTVSGVTGGGTITYSVSPALPTGMSLNTSTGAITGTPTTATAAADYTVTASNGCSSTTSAVNITVITALSGLTYTTSTISSCVGVAISTNSVTAIAGDGTITYSVSPALPTGMSLNTSTGAITGTPTTATAAANYTVTANNGTCTTDATINIEVLTPMSGLTYTSASVTYCTGSAITSNTVSGVTGGGTITYSVSPALPSGLSLNTSTGAITGTPTNATAAADYTVTASNGCTNTTSVVNITVLTAMSNLSYSAATASYCIGNAITANTATVTGGGTITYSVSPALPAGLSLNTSTGAITGTPSATATAANYTVTATNSFCSTTATVNITINALPTATISGDYSDLCIGSSTDLTVTLTGTGPWSITYTDGTTPVTVSASSSPAIISVTPSGNVVYTLSAVSDANCTATSLTGSATITVNVACGSITTQSIAASNFCQGSSVSVNFVAQGSFSSNTFTAQLSDASGSFASPVSIGTLSSNIGDGTTVQTITATIPVGSTPGTGYLIRVVSSSPNIVGTDNGSAFTVTGQPTTATNTSTATICTTGSATLAGNSPSIGTGSWSLVSGPSTNASQFADASVYNTTFTPAGGAGSYVVRWTISNSPCSASSADATITVLAPPTAATNSSATTICTTGSTTLAGNNPSIGSGEWSIVSGPSSNTTQFGDITVYNTTFTPDGGAGSYVVRWTTSNGPCATSTADATILVNALPTTASNGSATTICSTSSATLAGNNPTVGTGEWSVVSGPSSNASQFADATVYNTAFTPDGGAGSYVIRWTISNSPCSASAANATIVVNAPPSVDAGTAVATCSNSGAIDITTGSSASNYTSIEWTASGTGSIADQNSLTLATYTPSNADLAAAGSNSTITLTLTATPKAGCSANVTDTKVLTIYSPATPTISGTSTFCHGGSATLTASGGSGYVWSIDQNGAVTTSTTYPLVVSHSAGVTVSFTSDSHGCASATSSAITVVREYAAPTVYITGNAEYCYGTNNTLTAVATPGSGTIATYQWQMSTDNGSNWTNVGTNSSTYTVAGTAKYRVVVTNSHGCEAVACP